MKEITLFQVLLLPSMEVAARMTTLAEATAWVRAYNDAMQGDARQAILAVESRDSSPGFPRALAA